MSTWLLQAALELLLSSSAAILVVLVLRPAWRAAFGAAAVVALWAAVPAAMLAVATPARVVLADGMQPVDWGGVPTPAGVLTGAVGVGAAWHGTVLALWLAGTLVTASLHLLAQQRFLRQLAPLGRAGDHIDRSASTRFGAVVIGVLRPRIVLPADFERRYTPQQQELILLHEGSHVVRADLLASWLAAAFRCAFWFNPLVHYAARCLSHDQELASDAAVIRARPHLRGLYANTLLHDQLDGTRMVQARQWGRKPIEKRIRMLAEPMKSRSLSRTGAALAAAVALALAAGAWAAQPPRVDAGTAAWSSAPISLAGDDLTLRQAVEQVAAAANVSVAGGHLLDEARPGSDLDVSFTEIPASTALQIMLEEVSAELDYTIEERGVRFTRKE